MVVFTHADEVGGGVYAAWNEQTSTPGVGQSVEMALLRVECG